MNICNNSKKILYIIGDTQINLSFGVFFNFYNLEIIFG